eukprot:359219-Chlamydomonas_euryale.AAC.9
MSWGLRAVPWRMCAHALSRASSHAACWLETGHGVGFGKATNPPGLMTKAGPSERRPSHILRKHGVSRAGGCAVPAPLRKATRRAWTSKGGASCAHVPALHA